MSNNVRELCYFTALKPQAITWLLSSAEKVCIHHIIRDDKNKKTKHIQYRFSYVFFLSLYFRYMILIISHRRKQWMLALFSEFVHHINRNDLLLYYSITFNV